MASLTWLHLSDLHFRESDEYDIDIIVRALLEDLERLKQQEGLRPDLIFFTGDIAYSGKKEQYEGAASHFFDQILEATGLARSRLFIVPGNHDVDWENTPDIAYHQLQIIENDTYVKKLFDDTELLRDLFMRRMDAYAEFVRDYCHLPFSDQMPCYAKIAELPGRRVGVVGLNSAWASGCVKDKYDKVKDNGQLLLARHLVDAALQKISKDSPDVTIALIHHPFGWLKEFDAAQAKRLLMSDCDFILRGHLHQTETLELRNPDSAAMTIATGAVHKSRKHPNTYNLVRLDEDHKGGTVYLRRYGIDTDIWGADTLTYHNAPKGVWPFDLTKPLTQRARGHSIADQAKARLATCSTGETKGQDAPDKERSRRQDHVTGQVKNQTALHDKRSWLAQHLAGRARRRSPFRTTRDWLSQRGLRRNPFASWNAAKEDEKDLSGYFVDAQGTFDDIMETQIPCVVLAARGCGKTAYRRTIAAECRPVRQDSERLAIVYAYSSFERVLAAVDGDFDRVQPRDHAVELLRQGLSQLRAIARQDTGIKIALEEPYIAQRLAAYRSQYSPRLLRPRSIAGAPPELQGLSAKELLAGFSSLLEDIGMASCIVLVDEVDEYPLTAGKPINQLALLAPLLGVLPLIECQGFGFKFFLPQELEPALGNQEWFRPGRLRIFRVEWDNATLGQLIQERLTFFSTKGSSFTAGLAQLCEDNLARVIDRELVHRAEGRPRWAIVLADMLIRSHCAQPPAAPRIAPATWDTVKAEWPSRRVDLLKDESAATHRRRAPNWWSGPMRILSIALAGLNRLLKYLIKRLAEISDSIEGFLLLIVTLGGVAFVFLCLAESARLGQETNLGQCLQRVWQLIRQYLPGSS